MSIASFISKDTATKGTWIGVYGADGQVINALVAAPPAYATVTPSGDSSFTWEDPSVMPEALQRPGGATRILSAWYSATNMSFAIVLTRSCVLRTYHTDPDDTGRDVTVQILDSDGTTVLDTRITGTTAGLTAEVNAGVWYSWNVSGNVTVKVTRGSVGDNAVMSGILFDAFPTSGGGMGVGNSLGIGI